ncbi:DNA polymerase III subunit alpha [Mycoplasmopsis hyopharyngis]|uniref:DNA polymerase III subunit alpha n=1 Tax=Mycoplasmopsis hyopharyngis TaxID=29558 RepID=UPI00387300E0
MNKFINLHNNTEYSFLDSLIKIDDLVKETKRLGLPAAVISDHNNLFGLGIFLRKCKENNIKPIIGIDLDVKEYRFIVLAKNHKGFIKLNHLSLKAMSNETIEFDELNDPNIFVIDHPVYGLYTLSNKTKQLPFSNYFVVDEDSSIANAIVVKENKYLWLDEYQSLKIAQKISNLPESKESKYNFEDNPTNDLTIINRIQKIIDECNVVFPENKLLLPNFNGLNDQEAKIELKKQLDLGLKKRKTNLLRFSKNVILKRINYEYKTICDLNFQQYFLIIADLIKWAKEQNIAIGPGRGSSAGSLITYLLGITEINPLEYDLFFERFLNIDRVSWPDIDIDIQDDRRNEVIEYIFNKYGKDNVCLISTFQTIGAKMAIRDVGRVLNIDLSIVDKISKSIKVFETLNEAYQNNDQFKTLISKYPDLLSFSLAIEGQPRQQGIHAAGIVLSSKKMVDILPTCPTNVNNYFQTQLPMNYLEDFGLLKIDLLGLKTLTEIQKIEKYLKPEQIFENIVEKDFLEINDPLTLEMLNQGYTEGLFQLESFGMKKTIKQVHLDSFNDLYAIISLFRPGPLDYISAYAGNKKDPKLVKKIHPIYDEILAPTYGIIVYQEQIMLIAQKIALMSFSQADLLRRAISKKDEEKMKAYRQIFFNGAKANNIPEKLINDIYDNIEKFALYGFNKSHAVAYSFLTMKMAYYKVRHPLYFFASLISTALGSREKINAYAQELRNLNYHVKSPEICYSGKNVNLINNSIYLPFEMIKGLGAETLEKLMLLEPEKKCGASLPLLFLELKEKGLKDNQIRSLIFSNTFRRFSNMKTVDETFKGVVNCINYSIKEKEDIQKSIKNIRIEQYVNSLDLEFESRNEEEYLGAIYNAFKTIPYESDTLKLIDLQRVKSGKFVVEILENKKIQKRDLHIIKFRDSSLSLFSFITKEEYQKFSTLVPNKIVKLELSLLNQSCKILSFEEVINEKR